MTSLDLYNDVFYKLPKIYTGISYQDFVSGTLKEYQDRLKSYEGVIGEFISTHQKEIHDLCDSINYSIEQALNGMMAKSYHTLKQGIEGVKLQLLYRDPSVSRIGIANDSESSFYKIREGFSKLSKTELFHIPFNKRHLSRSNRFSIPGLPCIYLSNSLHLCWEELNNPINKRLYASRFEFDFNDVNLINLSYIPQKVVLLNREFFKEFPDGQNSTFFKESLVTWPLLFACLIHTRYRKADFKIEYIIPQHIVQWCKETFDIDGIKYFSTRTKYVEFSGQPFFQENIAFPVKSNKTNGHCDNLKKLLKITEPIKIHDLKHIRRTPLTSEDNDLWRSGFRPSFMNYLLRRTINHEKGPSIFDRVEIELLKQEAKHI